MRTRAKRRFNYGRAAFMVFGVCAVAFVLTNALVKIAYLQGGEGLMLGERLKSPLQYYVIRVYNGTWTEQDKRILLEAMQKASARTRKGVFCALAAGDYYDMEIMSKRKALQVLTHSQS